MRSIGWIARTLWLCSLVGGCGSQAAQHYALQGEVISFDAEKNLITVKHGDIPGFMPAMTMAYEMLHPKDVTGVGPGDTIRAELTIENGVGHLDKIQLVAKAAPGTPKPAPQVHIPATGDAVPDFHFVNQDGRAIHLQQFNGKVLLVTFIYTRCPLPDFCPRMNRNFRRVQELIPKQKFQHTEFLSISFDPEYDTPAVLKRYRKLYDQGAGGEFHADWQFAVPSRGDLPEVARFFGLVYESDGGTISHSTSTTVVGVDGKVVKWYGDNTWSPEDAAKVILGKSGPT